MRKRLTIITLCLILCLFIFAGCTNQLSSEARAYKEKVYATYEKRARTLIDEALSEKYGQEATITHLDIIANLDYSFEFTSEPYKKVATGKAQIGDEEFDVYLRWDIDNNPINFVCCDNREKNEILSDIEEYFTNLYGKKPYAAYYEIFSSLGYEFKKEDGMLQEKYSGNIEDYMNEFNGLINVAVAYENLESVFIEDTIDETGEISTNTLQELLKAKNVYIINTFDSSLTQNHLKSIISKNKIEEFFPLIKSYAQYQRGTITKWTNNMTEFAGFTYNGITTDKNILVDYDCDLTLDNWEDVVFSGLENYNPVSNWYFAPESESVFYISEDLLKSQSSKYAILLCRKTGGEDARYSADIIHSNDSGYLMVSPSYKNTRFIICAYKEPKIEILENIKQFFQNIL